MGGGLGVDDGGGAESGFVGENAAGDAHFDREGDGGSGETAGDGGGIEGVVEDLAKSVGNLGGVENENRDAAEKVDEDHYRHDAFGEFSDPFDTAKGDDSDEENDGDAADAGRDAELGVDGGGDGVGLDHVADSEGGESGEKRVGDGEPFPFRAETFFDVKHDAAGNGAVGGDFAVFHAERGFGEFRGHADESDHPHPEKSTRSAEGDRGADAGDVSDADGSGHGGGDGLEGGEGAGFGFGGAFEEAAKTFVPGEAEVGKLKKSEANREVNAGGGEENHERRAPDDAVEPAVKLIKGFQHIENAVS